MKRLYRILITSFIIFSFVCGTRIADVSADTVQLYGDIDQNMTITVRDALRVLKHVTSTEKIDDSMIEYADVDSDGLITVNDAYQIFLCACKQSVGFNHENIVTNGTVWIASDSIAAGVGNGLYGWGQVIDDYLLKDATIHNTAISGSTSKSFSESENYQTILNNMKAGDVLIICFGHNDTKSTRYPYGPSNQVGSFKYNLKTYYIDPAYRKGVQPILMSSPARCGGSIGDPTSQYHYAFTQAATELAQEYVENGINLPFIDMFSMTLREYQYLGKDTAYQRYHAGRDQIHYSETGARFAAQLILTSIKNAGWDFAKFIDTSKLKDPRSYPH